jgi:hypothetical protein
VREHRPSGIGLVLGVFRCYSQGQTGRDRVRAVSDRIQIVGVL